jgi:4-hydroxy-L-threonine phosphate dehydrogenase PdxA
MGSAEVVSQSRMDNAKSVVKDLNPFTGETGVLGEDYCPVVIH